MKPTTTMRVRRYEPLGRCMYCDTREGDLTLEHLIPDALGGTLTLPSSVCAACQETVNIWEARALQTELLVPRLLLALRRKPQKRKNPKSLPKVSLLPNVVDQVGSEGFDVQLDVSEYPPVIALRVFPIAGHIAGVDRGGDADSIQVGLTFIPGFGSGTAQSVTTRAPFQIGALEFALAKWAFGYAIAEGLDARCDLQGLRDLLAGRRKDVYNFVGGPVVVERIRKGHLHRLDARQRGGWLTISVQLFASVGVRPYEVVLGRVHSMHKPK